MDAIVCHRYGTPSELHLATVEKPVPDDNEVLVNIHASSINSWDWDLVRGRPYLTRLAGLRKPRFEILGADIAGRVESVGSSVRKFQPGDEVLGDISASGWGGFAEFTCAREDALTLKPGSMTFAQAAAMPQAGVLALQSLRKGQARAGQQVLINGAGGGVGTFAVQLAKTWGARVTGVDSAAKLDMLRSIGADEVIDYTQKDFTRNREHYDLIIDVVAQRSIFDYQRALRPGGRLVIVGGATGRILQVVALGPLLARTSGKQFGLLLHKPDTGDLDTLVALIEDGSVTAVIDRQYPLNEVPDAMRFFGEGRVKGKLVITT